MQIAITVFGRNKDIELSELTKIICENECNILGCQVVRHFDTLVGYLIVEGQWNQIVKIESMLQSQLSTLIISIQRFEPIKDPMKYLPYSADVVGADSIGIINKLILFFLEHSVQIEDVNSSCFTPVQTSADLFSAHFILSIPSDSQIISLRDAFFEFCDQLSLDAIFEPIKR